MEMQQKLVWLRYVNRQLGVVNACAVADANEIQVADAQATESKIAKALTGKPDTDKDDLDMLQTMFLSGIKQNQQNVKKL